jgi:hypothetical protein
MTDPVRSEHPSRGDQGRASRAIVRRLSAAQLRFLVSQSRDNKKASKATQQKSRSRVQRLWCCEADCHYPGIFRGKPIIRYCRQS